MSSLNLAALNGNSNGTSNGVSSQGSDWLQWTVKEFFTHVNWSDQPPEIQSIQISTLEGGTPELSLQLTVSQFFSAIPWDGKIAAAPVAAEVLVAEDAPPSGKADLNVDDFADFF
jgi:hypothetical protein